MPQMSFKRVEPHGRIHRIREMVQLNEQYKRINVGAFLPLKPLLIN